MKLRPILPLALAAVLTACTETGQTTLPQVAANFTPLFNGKDFSGWRGLRRLDPTVLSAMSPEELEAMKREDAEKLPRNWRIEDGQIVGDGQGPYLTTEREFGDIELLLDYQAGPGTDSGVILRMASQVQIWDFTEPGGKWPLGSARGSGGLWNNREGSPGKFPSVPADRPLGEWNRLRIIQVGERTTVYLNDRLVVDHVRMENSWDPDAPLPARGFIQLQSHSGEIRFRNLFVRTISAGEANQYLASKSSEGFTSIFDGTFRGWAGPVEEYAVEGGELLCRPGKGGTIYYDRELTDFQVRLEFQLPPGGNNGLAIRYPGQGDTAYVGMCELQVIDNTAPQYANLDPRQYHGSAYGMVAARRGYLRPVGEWNYQEVTVRGSRIVVELNGTVILDTDLEDVREFMANSPHPGKNRTSGYFGFAGHNDPVKYRNVYLRPMG